MRNLPSQGGNYAFRVEIQAGQNNQVIYTQNRESLLGLTEIHWTEDSGEVELLVCNQYAGPVVLAYGLKTHRLLDPSRARLHLDRQLMRKYSLRDRSDVKDILRWACSADGLVAYRRITNRYLSN